MLMRRGSGLHLPHMGAGAPASPALVKKLAAAEREFCSDVLTAVLCPPRTSTSCATGPLWSTWGALTTMQHNHSHRAASRASGECQVSHPSHHFLTGCSDPPPPPQGCRNRQGFQPITEMPPLSQPPVILALKTLH